MAESLFEHVAAALEQRSGLGKLEARGTLRIALKEAGLEPRTVTPEQMAVMLTRTMPKELKARGIDQADTLCQGLATSLKGFQGGPGATPESPEDVFKRLGTR
jgi:hypothetical protein